MVIGKNSLGALPDIPVIQARSPYKEGYQRPSVEHTGQGNDLFFTAYGGRWFRASPDWVRSGIEKVLNDYFQDDKYICCNDFYEAWGIELTDFGGAWGYSSDENYKYTNLDVDIDYFDYDNHPHKLVHQMGEPVYIITPNEAPIDYYLEV